MDRPDPLHHRLLRRLRRQPARHRRRHLLPADEEHHKHSHPGERRFLFQLKPDAVDLGSAL